MSIKKVFRITFFKVSLIMKKTTITTNHTIFNAFLKSDEELLYRVYQENRPLFVDFATEYFDCKSVEAGAIFRQAFTILYLNIKNEVILGVQFDVKEYLFYIGESLLNQASTIHKARKNKTRTVAERIDFVVAEKQRQKQDKAVLSELLRTLGTSCNSILKNDYFHKFHIKKIRKQKDYEEDTIVKTSSYQCLQRLCSIVEQTTDLKIKLLNM